LLQTVAKSRIVKCQHNQMSNTQPLSLEVAAAAAHFRRAVRDENLQEVRKLYKCHGSIIVNAQSEYEPPALNTASGQGPYEIVQY
jgi:hypothetical protein